MNPSLQTSGYHGSDALAVQRNRVLRNTYWLLALSMVPTVLGAWVGVSTGITRAMSPGISLMVFLGGAFAFMFAIEKTKNSAAGVPLLLAFTFFMGVMLSRLLGAVLGLANGGNLIMVAFAGTGAVVLLLIAALPTQPEAAAALAVFAPMSVISMAACTTAFAWVLTRPVIEPVYRAVLIPALGLFGLMFGLWYVGLT